MKQQFDIQQYYITQSGNLLYEHDYNMKNIMKNYQKNFNMTSKSISNSIDNVKDHILKLTNICCQQEQKINTLSDKVQELSDKFDLILEKFNKSDVNSFNTKKYYRYNKKYKHWNEIEVEVD